MFLVLLISSKTLKKVYSFSSQIGQQILLWKMPWKKKNKKNLAANIFNKRKCFSLFFFYFIIYFEDYGIIDIYFNGRIYYI